MTMKKELDRILQDSEKDIKEAMVIVRPLEQLGNEFGRVAAELVIANVKQRILNKAISRIWPLIDRQRRKNARPNHHNRTRKKQRLTRLQRRAKRQKR